MKKHVWIPALILVLTSAAPGRAADPNKAAGSVSEQEIAEESMDDLLLNRERYFYSSFGRRDPFGSLVKGKYARKEAGDLLDIGELAMVGVVWGEADKFCVVQDSRDHSHILREGDKVVNGRVVEITRMSLTVAHYFFGETTNVTIYLQESEGSYESH